MDPERVLELEDPTTGLRAVLVLDSTALGPAAGGVRTARYASREEARGDALRLARAMTIKCALAGLDAGGGKCVVQDHDRLDRPAAFRRLGELIEELGGRFRTAGDAGTTAEDLAAMAETCNYVHTGGEELSAAVARGVLACARACACLLGAPSLAGASAAVQGCGLIGAAVARTLRGAGAELWVADVDEERVQSVAAEVGARITAPGAIYDAEVDLAIPAALGGAITEEVARSLRARALCGPANNAVASPAAARLLLARGVLQVPDVLASAGAVIEGIGRTVMGLPDRAPLIDALGDAARGVLEESRQSGELPDAIAERRALARIRPRW